MSSVSKVGSVMRKLGCVGLLVWLAACGSEEPRTQITLMIDADPRVKAEIDNVRVDFASGPRGSASEDFVARTPQDFSAPLSWPLVVVLVPAGDDTDRAFRIGVSGRDGTTTLVEASARSHFLKGKHLALRMRLYDGCRSAVFTGCEDNETCSVTNGSAGCDDDTIDPTTLSPFDGVDSSSDAGFDAQVATPREIVGRVFSTDDLMPLSGATAALASGATATTNGNGEFTLTGSEDDRVITFTHPGHATAIKPLPGAASVYLEVFVKEVDVRQTLSATTGGSVQSDNGAAAVFPSAAFKRPNGTVEDGMAEVTLASPDTKDGAQAQAFPGDFKATAAGGKEGAFAAAAALDVTANAGGQKLNLNEGVEAEISLPVKSPGSAQTMDLWSFNPTSSAWQREGSATLTQDATGKPVYRAKISHLSWWAVGTLVEDTSCMHLCATYNNAAAAFARATVTGIDAPFQGSFFADESGCVAFDVPPSTQVSVTVQSIDGVATPRVVVSPSTLGSSDDLSTCDNLGTIALIDRNQSTSGCPSTWSACGGTCTDLSASPAHCGACSGPGAVCTVGQHCVDGTCGCANNETQCGSQGCVDTNSSALHCGNCDRPCGATQRCTAGACVDVTCAAPTTNCNGICVDLTRDGVAGQCPTMTVPDCVVPDDCVATLMCDDNGACVPFAACTGDGDCPSAYRCNLTVGMCAEMSCLARACGDIGAECDNISDGCGGVLNCGTCMASSGQTCGGGGLPNVCGVSSVCGDGTRSGTETCDDGDRIDNNACDNLCHPADICGGGDTDADTAIDEAVDFTMEPNCGACGVVCSLANATAMCAGGTCVVGTCAPYFADCDGMPSTGCETLLLTRQNCGACGNACGPNGDCQGGSCAGSGCGNGFREGSEQCDDGNVTPLDGCSATCLFEVADRCDNLDNDADSRIDEGPWGFNCSLIPFGTVVGECTNGTATCTAGVYACSGAVGPMPELCDGLDNDCNGTIDDNVVDVGNPCGNTVGACDYGVRQCVGGAPVCVGGIGPVTESCDTLDNDCDGFVDETMVGCNP